MTHFIVSLFNKRLNDQEQLTSTMAAKRGRRIDRSCLLISMFNVTLLLNPKMKGLLDVFLHLRASVPGCIRIVLCSPFLMFLILMI